MSSSSHHKHPPLDHDSELAFLDEVPEFGAGSNGALGPPPQVAALPAPTRDQKRARRSGAALLSLVWMAVHLAVYGVRQDFGSLPLWYVALNVGLPLALAVTSVFVALSPGRSGLGLQKGSLLALALLAPALFVVGPLATPLRDVIGSSHNFWLDAMVCFDITLAWSAVPLLAAALSLRHTFPGASAPWRAALIGAGCGLFSGATMNLHCPNAAALHVALGHGLPVLIATVIGGFLIVRLTTA